MGRELVEGDSIGDNQDCCETHRGPQAVTRLGADKPSLFHSILFPGPEPPVDGETREAPSCLADLNLDQVINAVASGGDDYDLKPFFYSPLRNMDAILYRHEVMHDVDRKPVADALRRFAQKFREIRQHLTLVDNIRYDKHNKNGWFLHATTIYCDTALSLKADLHHADLRSRGLTTFRDYLDRYSATGGFTGLLSEAKRIRANLSTVRYCVQISGLRVTVRKYAGEADYNAEMAQCFDKFRQRAVRIISSRLPIAPRPTTSKHSFWSASLGSIRRYFLNSKNSAR